MYRSFQVGQLFEEGKTHYQEATKFDFTDSGPILFLFFAGPTAAEIESVRGGNLKIGFLEKDDIIFLLFKFANMPWIDAPYTIHLSQYLTNPLAEVEKEIGYGLQIFLVDADTGILKVMRLIGLGTEWSRRFREAMMRQKERNFDQRIYEAKIQNIYRNFSSKDLAEMVLPKNWYRVRT